MEETRDDSGPAEQGPSNSVWWGSEYIEKFASVSLLSQDDILSNKESPKNYEEDGLSSQTASQVLWSTGMLSEQIPNGFYSVIPDKKLKGLFVNIPTLDELHSLGAEGCKADVILVDAKKDKKLSMLKQLIVALVKGLNSNPAAMIKKIAGLVSDFYKRPNVESPAKAALEEASHMLENKGVQFLGQIRHGSCRPRAIMFKVLADSVGLESRLMVGLPNDGIVECVDSYKHMSVIVVLNSVELLVDLMRFPGQLIPRSTRAIFMTHISAAGESDSAENDSCDSPLEPNSPLYGFAERVEPDSAEKDESLQFHRKLESSSNVSGPSLRNMMLRSATSSDRKLSLSHSEPNIATTFWRRSRKKVIAEQRTASSREGTCMIGSLIFAFVHDKRVLSYMAIFNPFDRNDLLSIDSHELKESDHLFGIRGYGHYELIKVYHPEHPSFRARGRSMLSGDRHSIRDYTDDVGTSSYRSEGASILEARRMRRRSISMTPEIGDDICPFGSKGDVGFYGISGRKPNPAHSLQKAGCEARAGPVIENLEASFFWSSSILEAVRAMNETLKQNRLLREHGDDRLFTNNLDDKDNGSDLQKNPNRVAWTNRNQVDLIVLSILFDGSLSFSVRTQSNSCVSPLTYGYELWVSNFGLDGRDAISGGRSALYTLERNRINSQKAISLPSSPHEYRSQTSERSGPSGFVANDQLVSTWNRVLESPMFHNKPLLPFQEWHIDFSELTVGTRVGIGFFGEVFRGVWNGTEVAIKVFLEQDLTAENMEDFCNEISILSGQKKKLNWRRKLKMLRDICRGLMCIHRMKIVHRDLKSANCLVNKHMTVKICDFGLSRVMTDTPIRDSSSAGTPEWMAPELIRNEPFSEKCDIFSLGVIMWELCTLSRPWEGVPPERVVYAVANEGSRLEIPEGPLGRLITGTNPDIGAWEGQNIVGRNRMYGQAVKRYSLVCSIASTHFADISSLFLVYTKHGRGVAMFSAKL
ncbi:unnamed protein product [Dovyalis caffra]|uniref:Protein kinase domain-containing protein n=1 Tax=Dovyalis caffra TaxID=77055 RepID=A0AAV1S9X8_9ROSI|nr:unnamed protein product [Dovyalis caffra]